MFGHFAQRGSQSSYSASDLAGGFNLDLHERRSLDNTHLALVWVNKCLSSLGLLNTWWVPHLVSIQERSLVSATIDIPLLRKHKLKLHNDGESSQRQYQMVLEPQVRYSFSAPHFHNTMESFPSVGVGFPCEHFDLLACMQVLQEDDWHAATTWPSDHLLPPLLHCRSTSTLSVSKAATQSHL